MNKPVDGPELVEQVRRNLDRARQIRWQGMTPEQRRVAMEPMFRARDERLARYRAAVAQMRQESASNSGNADSCE